LATKKPQLSVSAARDDREHSALSTQHSALSTQAEFQPLLKGY
jgi:hypothetical protein